MEDWEATAMGQDETPTLNLNDINPDSRAILMLLKMLNFKFKMQPKKSINEMRLKKTNPAHTILVPTMILENHKVLTGHAIILYLLQNSDQELANNLIGGNSWVHRSQVKYRLLFDTRILYPRHANLMMDLMLQLSTKKRMRHHKKKIHNAYKLLEMFLVNGDYMVGNTLTITDIVFVSTVAAMHMMYPLYRDQTKWPKLNDWFKRMREIPEYSVVHRGVENQRFIIEYFGQMRFPTTVIPITFPIPVVNKPPNAEPKQQDRDVKNRKPKGKPPQSVLFLSALTNLKQQDGEVQNCKPNGNPLKSEPTEAQQEGQVQNCKPNGEPLKSEPTKDQQDRAVKDCRPKEKPLKSEPIEDYVQENESNDTNSDELDSDEPNFEESNCDEPIHLEPNHVQLFQQKSYLKSPIRTNVNSKTVYRKEAYFSGLIRKPDCKVPHPTLPKCKCMTCKMLLETKWDEPISSDFKIKRRKKGRKSKSKVKNKNCEVPDDVEWEQPEPLQVKFVLKEPQSSDLNILFGEVPQKNES